ncbi:MAG: Fe-S protein assembly chaperone HscA [Rickettsiales bacterium]|nr:Fe-S protein assembly chaperone HscA [Rickettsiales bacterium]|tara:strand:+ start:1064 stop:2824 length:1761 start_codon:yes stop_codon:yes gene_type:complete
MALLQIHEPGQTPAPHATPAEPAIGIDLGTTHSVVAFSHAEKIEVYDDPASGSTLTPSVITHGDTELRSFKRFMGKNPQDIATHYALAEDNVLRFETSAGTITPVECSARLLRQLKERAESQSGQKFGKAVITVPAYFDDAARTATRDAARLAGLEVLRLLNEPTAAALAYGLDAQEEGTFAIYDLGGGTFDVSILKLEKGVFQVLATAGDTQLGGDDIDMAIMRAWVESGVDETQLSQSEWLQLARKAKEYVTEHAKYEDERVALSRETLDQLTQPWIARSMTIVDSALHDAGLKVEALDGVVLVGGSTRMPQVREAVATYFRKPPLTGIDPDEVVAVGAAIQAEALTVGADHLLLDVTPLSLGLETMGGLVEKLIWRNSPIPTSVAQEFTTYQDGQTAMKIHVLQGEREMVDQCRSLAEFTLRGIPPLPANVARIEVRFTIDADGLLTVSAKEMTTGTEQRVEVKPSYGLPLEEVEAMLRASMEHAQEDIMLRLLAEARVEAERLIVELNAAIAKDRNLLSDAEFATIQQQVETLSVACQGTNREQIDAEIEQLNHLANPFAERRMDKAIASALEGKKIEEVSS